jgi:hypothetical protein
MALGEAMQRAGKRQKARQYLAKAKKEYSALVKAGYRKHELDKAKQLLSSI